MAVITIDRHQLREIAEELSAVDQQLDLVAVVRVHSYDEGARIAVGFEELAFAVVYDDVTDDRGLNVVKRAVTVDRYLTCFSGTKVQRLTGYEACA